MSDLDTLVDMGFEREKASLALKSGGGLQGAIDYLDKNADKSLEDLQSEEPTSVVPTPSEDAKSLICNDCQKTFRTPAQAEFHATKTGHQDFSESTTELAPLTDAQKSEKLEELKARAAQRKTEQSAVDKEEQKRNNAIKRKATKEQADMKEELQKKEQLKEAAAKKREKQADVEAKKRVQDQIKRDREERKLKAEKEKAQREGQTFPAEAVAATMPAGVPVPKPSGAAHSEARLRLQTEGGNLMKNFAAETTLFEVAHAVREEKGIEVNAFESTFPRKKWEKTDFGMTLKEANMVPSASIIVR